VTAGSVPGERGGNTSRTLRRRRSTAGWRAGEQLGPPGASGAAPTGTLRRPSA